MTRKLFLSALAMSLVSSMAIAQTGGVNGGGAGQQGGEAVVIVPVEPPGAEVFSKLDADGDAFISKSEAEQHNIARNFSQFDTDKDGRLSASEYQVYAATPAGTSPPSGMGAPGAGGVTGQQQDVTQMFKQFDEDNDGYLSRQEAANDKDLASFDHTDVDLDGRLTWQEYQNAYGPGAVGRGAGGGDSELIPKGPPSGD